MNLNNFTTQIEEKIVNRGRNCFQNDYIKEVELVGKQEYSATIEGTEIYTTFVKLTGNSTITTHSCTCPYNYGDYCKHEVALLYYLKKAATEDRLDQIGSGVFGELKMELKTLNKTDLMDLVLSLAKGSKEVREDILWELGLRG